jgi:cell division transport system ATP-binding protein
LTDNQSFNNTVRFENVGMRYGTGPEVLREVTFTLKPGSFHFLTGRSGAGKSSLLKLMYLAHTPSRGLVTLFDEDIATLPHQRLPFLRRRVGVVFQEFRLLSHLSAFDNVALPLRVAGIKESTIRKNVDELLAWTGLGGHMEARPPTLSGGQQQRVAIARSLISRPMGVRLLYLFEELNRMGTTVVIATHSETLVSRFKKPILHLEDGVLIHHDQDTAGGGTGDPRDPRKPFGRSERQ